MAEVLASPLIVFLLLFAAIFGIPWLIVDIILRIQAARRGDWHLVTAARPFEPKGNESQE